MDALEFSSSELEHTIIIQNFDTGVPPGHRLASRLRRTPSSLVAACRVLCLERGTDTKS
jgi:hypothetical protein